METRTLQVNPEDTGTRLDAWLAGQLPERDPLRRRPAVRGGAGDRWRKAPGEKLPPDRRREAVSVTLPDPEPVDVAPQDIPLDVVYEDSDVIVVNKPKGLVVHPAPGHPDGTLVNALLHHCGDSLSGIGGELRPGIVHRIDRDTSGLIIAAKNDFAHQKLSAQLQDHTLARIYRCIVMGNLREDSRHGGRPHRPPPDGPKEDGGGGGRPRAVTHWRCWSGSPALPMWSAVWRPGAPTRSGSTWPTSATPFWGTRCTGRKSPCRVSRASASTRWGCGFSTPGPGSWWSCGATCRRRSRPSCGGWRTEDRTTPGRSQRSGAFAPGSRVSGGSWSGVRGIHRGQD